MNTAAKIMEKDTKENSSTLKVVTKGNKAQRAERMETFPLDRSGLVSLILQRGDILEKDHENGCAIENIIYNALGIFDPDTELGEGQFEYFYYLRDTLLRKGAGDLAGNKLLGEARQESEAEIVIEIFLQCKEELFNLAKKAGAIYDKMDDEWRKANPDYWEKKKAQEKAEKEFQEKYPDYGK